MTDKKAFTFPEILGAMFMLALFLTPVISLLQSSARGVSMNKDEVWAHCVAYELIEQVLSMPYPDVPVGMFGHSQILDGMPIGTGTTWLFHLSDPGPFSRQMEITEVSQDARARFKKIRVTLSASPSIASGTPRTFTRTALYAKELL